MKRKERFGESGEGDKQGDSVAKKQPKVVDPVMQAKLDKRAARFATTA